MWFKKYLVFLSMLQEDEGGGDCLPPMKKKREEEMNRIANLPEDVVHHIMSFLPTLDLTKLSILSKRFFFLWSSFPVLDFDEAMFNRGNFVSTMDDFLDHIRNSIQLRRISTSISELRVKADLKGRISSDRRLDSAISFALENGVKSMDLDLGFSKYRFPASFASRSINVLKLKGLNLDVSKLILACPSLKTLSLTCCVILRDIKFSSQTLTEIELHCCVVKFIKITAPNLHSFSFDSGRIDPKPCRIDVLQCQNIGYLALKNVVNAKDWVEEHISTLCKLETFIFSGCLDISGITIRNERVERVEISKCLLLDSVKVRAPSLKSFHYKGTSHTVSSITFIASESIKDLYIANADITDEWLEAQLDTWCYLESLRLKACNYLNKIEVIHEKLQILEFLNCESLEAAEIVTPELVSFVHIGNIIKFKKMVTRGICTATLFIKPWIPYNYDRFNGWRKMLSFFGHCKTLKLICNYEKELMIPGDLRGIFFPPLYDLQSLEVHVMCLKTVEKDLVDSLLWISPLPNTIRIYSGSRSQLQMIIKFGYNQTMEEEEENKEEEDKYPFCCTNKPIKCWRHTLKRLDIQTKYTNGLFELQSYFRSNTVMLEMLSFSKLQDDFSLFQLN